MVVSCALGWLLCTMAGYGGGCGVPNSVATVPGPLTTVSPGYGIDANAIVAAAEIIAPGRPIRHLRALG